MVQEHKPVDEVIEETSPPKATRQEVIEDEPGWQPPMRQEKPASRMSFGNSGGIGKMALVSLVVAILVMLLLGMMGGGTFVTKKDFETNMANMAVSVNEATASVNAAVQGLPNTVSSTVNNAISQQTASLNDSINKMNGTVANLQSSVSQVSNDVAAVSTKIDEEAAARKTKDDQIVELITGIDKRVDALETVKEEEAEAVLEPTKDDITLEAESYDLSISSTDANTTIGLYCRNKSDAMIKITKISLLVYPSNISSDSPLKLVNYSSTVPLNWNASLLGGNFWMVTGSSFASIGGWKIPDDDKREAFLGLTFDLSQLPETAMNIMVELNDFEYEVVE